jgi:hypothetical protein
MNLPKDTLSFLTTLGVGFLIGIVRERLHQPGAMMNGGHHGLGQEIEARTRPH